MMTQKWSKKYHLIELDNIDSTNNEAKRRILSDSALQSVIWTHKQTAGRGRYGRQWEFGASNLYMSILLPLTSTLDHAAELSFVTGLATYEVINLLAKSSNAKEESQNPYDISLKWPNDIFIDDNKIGGILLESITHANQTWIIIGLGLNLEHSPTNIANTSCLREYRINITSQNILNLIMESFEKYYNIWHTYGFVNIRTLWLNHAYRLGMEVTIGNESNRISGIFKSIDESGAIELRLSSGEIYTMSTGEMFF